MSDIDTAIKESKRYLQACIEVLTARAYRDLFADVANVYYKSGIKKELTNEHVEYVYRKTRACAWREVVVNAEPGVWRDYLFDKIRDIVI